MLAQSTFAGTFRRDTNPDGDEEWQCQLCSTSNNVVADDLSPRCKTCHRLRSPSWLLLEDSGLQIVLGSRVFHASVGESKSVSVVVAINYVQKVVTLMRVKTKRNEGHQQDDISFHEVVLNALQLQKQLERLDAMQEEDCVVDCYGICAECRGVFRVAQGDQQSQYANEDKISELQRECQQLRELKQRLAREKVYEKALECTEQIKMKTKQLQVSKRALEFLSPVFCPFCGRASPPPGR